VTSINLKLDVEEMGNTGDAGGDGRHASYFFFMKSRQGYEKGRKYFKSGSKGDADCDGVANTCEPRSWRGDRETE